MKRKKGNADRLTAGVWWSRNRWSCVILAAALVLFIVVRMAAVTFEQPQPRGDEYAEYETGVVTDILSDNTEADAVADGGYRGEQLLLAQVAPASTRARPCRCITMWGRCTASP